MFEDIKQIQSSDENVSKFVFKNSTAVAETVLYKYPTYEQRTVLCCSTQSGCPVGCRFCGTGNYFVRSLSPEEIVFQVDHCLESKQIDAKSIQRFQIMVMSMGEPLLNFNNLNKAFSILYKKYPNAKLLISSIGPRINYEPVLEMSENISTVGLQFSVHESTDEARNNLIPFKQKLTLKEIAFVGEQFLLRTGRKPFFNYCVHPGNTSQQDADRLASIFNPAVFEATISVICESTENMKVAHEKQQTLASGFMSKLLELGYGCRMFDPAGQDDIGGGCGQLWFVQQWMKDNQQLTKRSVGFGLPVVHAP